VNSNEPDPDPASPVPFGRDAMASMRREYCRDGLRRADLAPDPFAQFERWFDQAREAGVIEPNAMSLATVTPDGRAVVRTVLLKGFDTRGFVFFTNLESNKASQIAGNPNVSLLFPWLLLERQVIVTGVAQTIPASEVLQYFVTRPYGSQLAAWTSPQSSVIASRAVLEMKLEEMKRTYGEGKVPVPPYWGGFRVAPGAVEFWQGRPNRLHDRFLYRRHPEPTPGTWTLDRLAP
jgi:pyridoxamine 5'-phosphate oxidase